MPADERMDIHTSLVTQLITTQFPQWADLSIKPVALNGWDNKTFHLGENMSVRLPRAECYSGQVEKEHQWLPVLASHLPLNIPTPLAMGNPAHNYPWHWSIYRWLDGKNATRENISDVCRLATTLAQFLNALQRINTTGGPAPGQHNFFRGGPLTVYDSETRKAIVSLHNKIDTGTMLELWEQSLAATWQGQNVWLHGDVSPANLLVKKGQLSAVIDFGCLAVGDPACDVTIAWTLFSGKSREAFRTVLSVDEATWARGRGWALWKAVITLVKYMDNNPLEARKAQNIIDEVIADYKQL